MTGPLYPFKRDYKFITLMTSNQRHLWHNETYIHTKTLRLDPPVCQDFFKYKIIKNLGRTLFPFWIWKHSKFVKVQIIIKVLTELLYLQFLRSIIQQHLTIRTAYISDYSKSLPELSCLESRLILELQGAPGSRDHQASPSSLFGYQNTTDSEPATPGG